jgi:glycine oxidase
MYAEFVERVGSDSGQPIEFRRCGTLQVARTAAEHDGLEVLAGRLSERGVQHEIAVGADVRRLEPAVAAEAVSALLIPEHGYVRVADLLAALVASFPDRISFRRGRVVALEPQPSGVRVRTDNDVTTADMLVVAAGAWSGPLAIPALPVRPVRGQVVELQCGVRPFSRILWDESCYMVPWCNGSVLVGATSEDVGFDETVVADATRRLTGAAQQLVPALAAARVSGVRVGLRPATPDELPVIGRSSTMPHVVYATGHYRHGILLAPLTATLVADLVTGASPHPLLGLVQPSRFTL